MCDSESVKKPMKRSDGSDGRVERIEGHTHIFRASKLWEFNTYGSVVAGLGAGILMIFAALIVVWHGTDKLAAGLLLVALIAVQVGLFLAYYRGNLVAYFPYAVAVDANSGLRLFAPYKEIYIPLDEVSDIYKSFLNQGYVVRLRRRQGLLRKFVIPWFFGRERESLIQTIRLAVEQRRGDPNKPER